MKSRDELLDEVERLDAAGDKTRALVLLRTYVDAHSDAIVLCRLGSLAADLGEIEEADLAFRRALQLDVSLGSAYIGLASIAIDGGDYKSAEDLLRKSLRYEQNETAYCMLGVVLEGLDKEQEARECFQRAIEVDPGFEEPYFNLGVSLRFTDPDRAERLLSKAVELEPSYAEAHRELGWLQSQRTYFSESEYHLSRAVELQPEDVWAHIYLANHFWQRGDPDRALVEFHAATEIKPLRTFALWSLANFYEDQREWEKAQALYERASQLKPDDIVANMNFGRMLKKKGELSAAKVYLERALFLDPNYSEAKTLLAELTLK